MTLYNDNDPACCAWLRELITANHLPGGAVLHQPIETLHEHPLISGSTTFHAFAGIGGWPLALRLAGWPDNEPVWTGSCPCQPFSCAGKRAGASDKRHLWPDFLRLIAKHRPPTIFGEQVASKGGREWLAGVRADLEALGYAVGASDLCAASVGAPHIRQRLYWVAFSQHPERRSKLLDRQAFINGSDTRWTQTHGELRACGEICGVGDASSEGGRWNGGTVSSPQRESESQRGTVGSVVDQLVLTGIWGNYDLIPCLDGKTRRIEPGTFPLAHGVPARVVRLRGYGNAIVPQLAAEFVLAFREACIA